MSKKYKAVLFDYDGTLVDTNQLIVNSWKHMYRENFGGTLSEDDVKWTFGIPLVEGVDRVVRGKGHSGFVLDDLVRSYRSYQTPERLAEARPFEGIPEVLFEMKRRGALLGIVTSRQTKSCIEGLKNFGLYDLFDGLVAAETTDIHKPLPEPALICCRQLGVDPSEAVMVGDSVFDLQCGNAAGCGSCFVAWSFATSLEKAEKECNAGVVAYTPSDLLDLI